MSELHHDDIHHEELHMEADDIDAIQVGLVGLAFTLFLLITVLYTQTFFYSAKHQEEYRKIISEKAIEYSQLRSDQLENIHSYKVINENEGIIQIPVEIAMNSVVKEYAAQGDVQSNE